MKKILIYFPIIAVLTASLPANDQSDEIIRLKIENSNIEPITAFSEPIYCVSSLSQFYQHRIFQTAWTVDMADKLIAVIASAGDDGLNPEDYHLNTLKLKNKSAMTTPRDKADYDLILTDAFLLYASHLLSGKVNPETIDADWHVVRREGDPIKVLQYAVASGDIVKSLADLLPKHAIYQSFKKALCNYQKIEQKVLQPIPDGETIKKNMVSSRIPIIRERLILLGDLSKNQLEREQLYDEKMFVAMQKFQERHGLDNDGNIGPKTIAALNVPVAERIRQIEVNMERWRWLPQEFGDYYIKVNIASFDLEVIKGGKLVRTHKIIAGKPYRSTPVFSSKMQYLVFNPTWTIPPGILNNDILPAVRKDISYLNKKKLTVLDNQGNVLDPNSIDWSGKAAKSYTYRQAAGPDNALGAVKFMFPNKFHVYLHDTPSRELFDKTERAFSSGCVRVHNPLLLAEYLLNDPIKYNMSAINKIISTTKTQTVQLKEQPNVHLLYWTAWADSAGVVQFRRDIYERDKKLADELYQNALKFNN